MNVQNLKIYFFGTGPLAESVLFSLYKNNIIPSLVITKPDSLVGRDQVLTSPSIKKWCDVKGIKTYQPESLKTLSEESPLLEEYDLAIVASYGKIIPENVLSTPKFGFLNVHPSTLPLYRGPSPIESQLLDGLKEIGLSIMKLDEEMDHGDILIQKTLTVNELDTSATLEIRSGQEGGELLVQILEHYVNGSLKSKPQDHSSATFCKFIEKSQGEIKLTDNLDLIKNKWRAFYPWPSIFFFINHQEKLLRVKVTKFNLKANTLDECIESVVPEGKSEMSWESFKNGYNVTLQ